MAHQRLKRSEHAVGISRKLPARFHAIVNNSNEAHTAVNTMSAAQFAGKMLISREGDDDDSESDDMVTFTV